MLVERVVSGATNLLGLTVSCYYITSRKRAMLEPPVASPYSIFPRST
jgi:hypothetical protein